MAIVQSGSYAVFLDGDETVAKLLLRLQSGEFLLVSVQFYVVECGFKDHFLTRVFERHSSGIGRGASRADVIRLRVGVNQRIRLRIQDRRLADREAIGVADIGVEGEIGKVGVSSLGQARCCAAHVGFSHVDLAGVSQGKIDRSVKRNTLCLKVSERRQQTASRYKGGSSSSANSEFAPTAFQHRGQLLIHTDGCADGKRFAICRPRRHHITLL